MLSKMPSCMSRQHPKRFENQTGTRPPKWVNSNSRWLKVSKGLQAGLCLWRRLDANIFYGSNHRLMTMKMMSATLIANTSRSVFHKCTGVRLFCCCDLMDGLGTVVAEVNGAGAGAGAGAGVPID